MKQNLKENKEEKMTEAYIIDAARTPEELKVGEGLFVRISPQKAPRYCLGGNTKRNDLVTQDIDDVVIGEVPKLVLPCVGRMAASTRDGTPPRPPSLWIVSAALALLLSI